MRFLVLAILLAGCGPAATPTPSTHQLTGTMTLTADRDGIQSESGPGCYGTGGYDDIVVGTDVKVRDESGTLIATGALGDGNEQSAPGALKICVFTFTVADVPDAAFYSVEIANRGELTYSAAEMDAADWAIGMTLGD